MSLARVEKTARTGRRSGTMPIHWRTGQWLKNEGYRHYAFISWPHTKSEYMTRFARRLKRELVEHLALQIEDPRVFLDDEDIPPGDYWRHGVRQALCESVAMVALCAPVYFNPSHDWCGLEWAAMANLGAQRLGPNGGTPIIPVVVSELSSSPSAFSEVQPIKVFDQRVRGRYYFESNDFREKVQEIVTRIEAFAERLSARGATPNCREFDFPKESAFLDYHESDVPRLPMVS